MNLEYHLSVDRLIYEPCNSLVPGSFGSNFKSAISENMLQIKFISSEIAQVNPTEYF